MKISVISGLYNCEKYVSRCLDSILGQTYANIEIILVNNASKDNTGRIVKKYIEQYRGKIKYYETDEKLGAGGSRKKGMELATGEYLCFIDCDDYISPGYIKNMVECAEHNNYPDIVYCSFSKVCPNGKVLYTRTFKSKEEAIVQGIAPWAKIFKTEYMKNNKLEMRNIPWGEDVIFGAEIYMTDPRVEIADEIEKYFWVNNLESTSHTEIKNFPERTIEIAQEYFKYMEQKYLQKKELEYFMIKYFLWYLLQSGMGTSKKKMLKEYKNAFLTVEKEYPMWWKDRISYVSEDRKVIRIAIKIFCILKRMHMDEIFLKMYCKLPMEKIWPSL